VIALLLVFLAAAGYQAAAIVACLLHLKTGGAFRREVPAVSILKPVYGADDEFYEAIESHARLDAPKYEILFGVHSLSDAAVPHIRRLQQEYPSADIRLIESPARTPNAKVGTLIDLAREARYPVLLINDSDIRVTPDYLRQIAAPLADSRIGLVTCLYRARARSRAARLEALGIATDFTPSVLVAAKRFGLGSTLCLRAEDLKQVGGFEAIASYLADDYQLGKRISESGLLVYIPKYVAETHLGSGSWRDIWNHQVRWARTIRVSRPGGYLGLPLTNGTVWAIAAGFAGWYGTAAGLLMLRLLVGLIAGLAVLRDPLTARLWWLMPARDLFGAGVWVAGLFGRSVTWRGRRMRLRSDGTIE
jgi:ceramide glucosyltransferase